jgi:hypothetical protein
MTEQELDALDLTGRPDSDVAASIRSDWPDCPECGVSLAVCGVRWEGNLDYSREQPLTNETITCPECEGDVTDAFEDFEF